MDYVSVRAVVGGSVSDCRGRHVSVTVEAATQYLKYKLGMLVEGRPIPVAEATKQ